MDKILCNYHTEQLINKPTHITGNSGKILDIITTDSSDLIEDVKIEATSLSLHCDISKLLMVRKPRHE